MTEILMGDWSDPGTSVYGPECTVGAWYLTGSWTPHAWTKEQVDAQPQRWMMPIWVAAPARLTEVEGFTDGHAAVKAAKSFGMTAGRIAVDVETRAEWDYTHGFRTAVASYPGWWTVVYGSASSVFKNYCPGGGWWVADWVGHPYEHPGAHVWGTQFDDAAMAHKPYDLSELRDLTHLWDRRPAPPVVSPTQATLKTAAAEAADIASRAADLRTVLAKLAGS